MNFSNKEIEALRADTPACEKIIHFNNAGSSLMPIPVYKAVIDHLSLENSLGGYAAEDQSRTSLNGFYTSFAKLLNADANEIAYVENATRAWDMAFYSLPLKEGDQIITHESEYASNYLAFLQLAKRRGIEIILAPSDSSGQVDVEQLEKRITSRTKLIALTHIPTQGGLVNPVEAIGKIANDHGVLYLLDACQSVGQVDIDVKRIGCHILSGTGRKYLRGPRGTGFLYVSKQIIDSLSPPFIDLHAAKWIDENTFEYVPGAKRFENFESYVAGRIGLKAAVDYALEIGLNHIEKRVISLARNLRSQLADIDGISVHDLGERQCGIVTFSRNEEPANTLYSLLSSKGVNLSISRPEYAQIDFGRRGLSNVVRASVHYFNTTTEISEFCELVANA